MTDKRTQELIDRGWYMAARARIETDPANDVQVSEETKNRIGRIGFKSIRDANRMSHGSAVKHIPSKEQH